MGVWASYGHFWGDSSSALSRLALIKRHLSGLDAEIDSKHEHCFKQLGMLSRIFASWTLNPPKCVDDFRCADVRASCKLNTAYSYTRFPFLIGAGRLSPSEVTFGGVFWLRPRLVALDVIPFLCSVTLVAVY